MMDISKLADSLTQKSKEEELITLDVQPIPGEVEVLQITVEDREELPVFLSVADSQIICICHLFKKSEIDEKDIPMMNEAMLAMNIPMPLSSFALIGEQYVVFGALSVKSSIDEIVHEIEMLSDNALEAIEAMSDYLK